MRLLFPLIIFLFASATALAQSGKAVVYGIVTDESGNAAVGVTVYHISTGAGTITDKEGGYEVSIPAGTATELVFSYITTIKRTEKIPALKPGQRHKLDVQLNTTLEFGTLEIVRKGNKNSPLVTKIDPKIATSIPTAGSGIEALIKTLPGVSSNNELSSQYSVRGGNFDENLVYINGIEIYRPLLVRSGQQEGLSIINSELVDNVAFSAGGFESFYGDKLSSVLDITYKEPVGFEGSVSAGLLGANMHVGGSSKNHRFTYLAGARYHTNRYLLGSLETSGDYTPSFTDLQAYFTYDVSTELTLGWLTYYGRNRYQLVPETRETTFGTPNLVVRLSVYFDGQEILEYNNLLNGLIATWKPNDNTELRWTASAYQTIEQERFDIIGQYYLDQLETDPNSDNFGGVRVNLGVGGYLNHARNDLYGFIYNFEHSGSTTNGNWLDLSINEQIERLRLRASTSLLSGRRDVLVVASVSCIYGIGNPNYFKTMTVRLRQGEIITRNKLLHKLVEALFSRTTAQLQRGTFRVSGDIVDVMPPYADFAFRVNFWGDEIETLQVIDPDTGKTLEDRDELNIFPANLFVTTKDVMWDAIRNIQDDLVKQA